MRLIVASAFCYLISALAAPATAQEPMQSPSAAVSVVGTPISPQDGAGSLRATDLEFAWGLDVATGRSDLVDFTGYAMEWSSLRLADGRILAFAYKYGPGPGPNGIRYGRLAVGVPSSSPVEEGRVFRAPRARPQIEGYTFQDAFWVSASEDSVGLWRDEATGDRVLISFGEATASKSIGDYVVLGRIEMDAGVVSVSHPLHGGPLSISVSTRPTPDGKFRIMTYWWRREA